MDRLDPLDVVLDCCSSLEALFQTRAEHRLRTALGVYETISTRKQQAFRLAYHVYGLRSEFVHGGRIPSVSDATRLQLVALVAAILGNSIHAGRAPKPDEINTRILERFGGASK